jgi:PIN domain nuclease of toxin-antitoxin system
MNLLVDTHILLWWLADDAGLPRKVRLLLLDTENLVYVSSATMWEIAIKRSIGKLEIPATYRDDIVNEGFKELSITWEHARRTAELPPIHRDPFDRMLIAQALSEKLVLVTTDETIGKYEVAVIPGS